MSRKSPKSNYSRYYFGVRYDDGRSIVTTSSKKLSLFIGISKSTITKRLGKAAYYSTPRYIIGVSDSLVRQDKGNRAQLKANVSNFRDVLSQASEHYEAQKVLQY